MCICCVHFVFNLVAMVWPEPESAGLVWGTNLKAIRGLVAVSETHSRMHNSAQTDGRTDTFGQAAGHPGSQEGSHGRTSKWLQWRLCRLHTIAHNQIESYALANDDLVFARFSSLSLAGLSQPAGHNLGSGGNISTGQPGQIEQRNSYKSNKWRAKREKFA